METMKDNMLLRRHHLHVLIRPCLERVNLASGIGDIYFALEFIQERCQVRIERLAFRVSSTVLSLKTIL